MFKNWKYYLLISIVIGLFIPLLYSFGFVADDLHLLYAAIKNPFPLTSDWTGSIVHLFRPLTIFSLWLNYQFAGSNPFPYYLTNLLLHVLSAYVIYRILLLLNPEDQNKPKRQNVSLAFLFFLIPQNLQNVFWISGRNDILCGLFLFISIYYVIRFFNEEKYIFLIASLSFQVLSFLSKEPALAILFYIPLLFIIRRDYIFLALKRWRSSILLLFPTAAYIIFRLIIFTDYPFGRAFKIYTSFYDYIRFYFYAPWTLFIPFDVTDTVYLRKSNPILLYALLFIILILIIAAIWLFIKNRKFSIMRFLPAVLILTMVSQAIYFKTWPAMRLVYPFSLFILFCFFILIQTPVFPLNRGLRLKTLIIILYFFLIAAGDVCLVNRTVTINNYYKNLYALLPYKIDQNKLYYVIAPPGMLGESWTYPESGLIAQLKSKHNLDYSPRNFFNAGAFDGYSFSNPIRDLSVNVISPDSVLLNVNNNFDYLAPYPTELFPPSGEYVYLGMNMKIKLLSERYKRGKSSSCLLILDKPDSSEIIIVK